ncbi:MAG: protein kinase [Myxococcales bacterium]|nr:protein kinase [Myxococcales bacterium]
MSTKAAFSSALAPGEVFAGKYRIERVLGQGGMGVVLAAHHLQLDELVAIKVLHPTFATQPDQVERFLREGRAAVKIRSEHVARVSDIGTVEGGVPYMVMEFLEGHDLGEIVKARGKQSVDDVVTWVLQACEALAEAHALGIVHRDLKPANLFLTQRADGSATIKVLDFGISKLLDSGIDSAALTNTNGMMGSPLYMSPEQLHSPKGVDARADVWALGVILFEMLTGERPYSAESLPALVLAIATEPPRSLGELLPGTPRDLEAIVDRCLEKKAEHRFADIGALARALLPFAPKGMEPSVERIQRVLASVPRRSKTGTTEKIAAVKAELPGERATGSSSSSQSGPRKTVNPAVASLQANSVDEQQEATLLEPVGPRVSGAAAPDAKAPKGLSTTNVGVSASQPPPSAKSSTPRGPLPWIAGIAVAGAIAVLGITLARGPAAATKGVAAPASTGAPTLPHGAASSATVTATVSAPSAASTSASTSAAPVAPSVVAPPVVTSPVVASSVVAPTKGTGKVVPPKGKSNCDPPYTLDADGQKHFKVECL